jgi:Zn-dependent peptidase ImmA (M78 family)
MAIRRKLIRALAEGVLEKQHVKHAPVPIDRIVQSLGIELKFDEVDDDLSGFLFRDTDGKKIVIGTNRNHHPNRQRFTIAHELGHFFLHKGQRVHLDEERVAFRINRRDSTSTKGEDDEEREANLLAAELLMPAKFLANDLKGKDLDLLGEDDGFLQKLADKYGVSSQALTFRLANLGYIEA